MAKRDKGFKHIEDFVSKAEQSEPLSRNKDFNDCSALELVDSKTRERLLIDQFASIIVEMFLEAEGYTKDAEERRHVLPGINERAGRRGQ